MARVDHEPSTLRETTAGRAFCVLLVDQDLENLEALAKALRFMRTEVSTARDAGEALGLLEGGPGVQAIISAHTMEDMLGVDLLEHVMQRWPHIQRVLLTTRAQLVSLPEGVLRAGVFRHLFVPWHERLLESALREARLQHEILAENERLLATLDGLSGWVAHELNNPLTGILAFSQMMKVDLNRSPEDIEQLDYIVVSARRCAVIVESILAAVRLSTEQASEETTLGASFDLPPRPH